jgi:hypothetical protein
MMRAQQSTQLRGREQLLKTLAERSWGARARGFFCMTSLKQKYQQTGSQKLYIVTHSGSVSYGRNL